MLNTSTRHSISVVHPSVGGSLIQRGHDVGADGPYNGTQSATKTRTVDEQMQTVSYLWNR